MIRKAKNGKITIGQSWRGNWSRPFTAPFHLWVRTMLPSWGIAMSNRLVAVSWSGIANRCSGVGVSVLKSPSMAASFAG